MHRAGAVVLFGRCDEEMKTPYHPFVEALGEFVVACPDDQLRGLIGPLGGELASLAPSLQVSVSDRSEPMRAAPGTERYRLFEAVVDLFAAMSSAAPVLLLLDDLHWADTLSLLLLRHLLRSNEPMRLLVIGTYRDTDIGRNHPLTQLLPDLRRERRGLRLALSRLVEDDVAAMVAAAADRELTRTRSSSPATCTPRPTGTRFALRRCCCTSSKAGACEPRDAGCWPAPSRS